jgi:hypothetical protein
VLIVADKQILCATCGKLVGLGIGSITHLKDRYVISVHQGVDEPVLFCNIKCKERAQV